MTITAAAATPDATGRGIAITAAVLAYDDVKNALHKLLHPGNDPEVTDMLRRAAEQIGAAVRFLERHAFTTPDVYVLPSEVQHVTTDERGIVTAIDGIEVD